MTWKSNFLTLILQRANDLVRNKIHPTSIISGYRVSAFYFFLFSLVLIFSNCIHVCLLQNVLWLITCYFFVVNNPLCLTLSLHCVQLAMREACKYVEEKLAVKVRLLK